MDPKTSFRSDGHTIAADILRPHPARYSEARPLPVISRFFGIDIKIYYNDHSPPHFHAEYGDDEAQIDIGTFGLIKGALPTRALGLVVERATLRQDELRTNWERARSGVAVEPIAPLE